MDSAPNSTRKRKSVKPSFTRATLRREPGRAVDHPSRLKTPDESTFVRAHNTMSSSPTSSPELRPSSAPSASPTFRPSLVPTLQPSLAPTLQPSLVPTFQPSLAPTFQPSLVPTLQPSLSPTFRPSLAPTLQPSPNPTLQPSFAPTFRPSLAPTLAPSLSPTLRPTPLPSCESFYACALPWLVVLTLVVAWLLKRACCNTLPVFPVFIPRGARVQDQDDDEAYDSILQNLDSLAPMEIAPNRIGFVPHR